jgi:hypothetical protein
MTLRVDEMPCPEGGLHELVGEDDEYNEVYCRKCFAFVEDLVEDIVAREDKSGGEDN